MLYVDSPAGTGLSYTEGAKEYKSDDGATIDDLYVFITKWLGIHPEWKGHPLYLAGEGRGGGGLVAGERGRGGEQGLRRGRGGGAGL